MDRNNEFQKKKLSTSNDKYLDLKHEIMEVTVEDLANQDIEMEDQVPKDLEKRAKNHKHENQYVRNQLPTKNPGQSTPPRPSRVIPPMPSEETMRHSIADNLMEILVNMTNPQHRQQCFSLLQVGDALQARSRILGILQQIDERRRTRN
ncbi:uncharacterized protein LOC6619558 isoform X2 [Drosophila sechellia]|uniref:uncharacterized protein LOC6619558 isoform X2 n=1 Tax=Drosophila sechellia TaxID=7238 RepID=UPI0013DE35C1|nr:uncharacterized protein LOC6619558 isoform X2 [Drosophila sechellia]